MMVRHYFLRPPCMGQNHHSHYVPFQTGGLENKVISRAPDAVGRPPWVMPLPRIKAPAQHL